ncbi:MAG: hypothetical protein WC533_05030 [Candidatus Pacearchaeota archaeon]
MKKMKQPEQYLEERFKVGNVKYTPIDVTLDGYTTTFLYPPVKTPNYFGVSKDFQKRGSRIPTARELWNLLYSAGECVSSDWDIQQRLKSETGVIARNIIDSWDQSLQSSTWIQVSKEGIYILEDPFLDHTPSEDELEDRLRKKQDNITLIRIPAIQGFMDIRKYPRTSKGIYGNVSNLPILKSILGKRASKTFGPNYPKWFTCNLDGGFIYLFFKDHHNGKTNHIGTINPNNSELSTYYQVRMNNSKLPVIERLSDSEISRSHSSILEIINDYESTENSPTIGFSHNRENSGPLVM